ncbi:MAG TPA: triose-phosphate isomerase [Syntrophus sp. (in: bacteria)]|nr:triose-phosphate isomerase [Syntrophus sp. (in: bacteria)]
MIRPLIAGNWKMHKTVREAVAFAGQLREALPDLQDREVVVAPPFPALVPVAEALRGSAIALGAQNLHDAAQGAFTGEVSATMLVDAGCRFVIVGHSERRALFGETDAFINHKLAQALASGLVPIFCIGETLPEREADRTLDVVARQLKEGLNNLSSNDIKRITLAYEPVWAIGTGRTASPAQAQEVHAAIRQWLAERFDATTAAEARILYGGSVNPGNIASLMCERDVNGALVGGASLECDSFRRIVMFD